MDQLPFRLRALRRQRSLTLDQLAAETGLTKSFLSKLERGMSTPSIATVLKLARAYELGISELINTEGENHDETVSVVRLGERKPLVREGNNLGYRYEAVAGKRLVKVMEPFIVHPPRAYKSDSQLFVHTGEEFLIVLKGSIEVVIGKERQRLNCGDSVYFDAELPHRIRTVSRTNAEVLIVVAQHGAPARGQG